MHNTNITNLKFNIFPMMYSSLKRYSWIFAVILLASCSIQEEIHFNKDFSGKVSYTIDLSSMMSMAKAFAEQDSSGESQTEDMDIPIEQMEETLGKVQDIEGISNFESNSDEKGIVKFSFDFANLDALNEAYNKANDSDGFGGFPSMGGMGTEMEEEEESTPSAPKEFITHFAKKGKSLVYVPRKGIDSKEDENPEAAQMAKQMGDMLKLDIKFTFDRRVKKVDAQGMAVYSDENSITISRSLFEAEKEDSKPQVLIKLK